MAKARVSLLVLDLLLDRIFLPLCDRCLHTFNLGPLEEVLKRNLIDRTQSRVGDYTIRGRERGWFYMTCVQAGVTLDKF